MQLYGRIGKNIGTTPSAPPTAMKAACWPPAQAGPEQRLRHPPEYPEPRRLYVSAQAWGAGFALTYKQKYTFLADYRYQNWNGVAAQKSVYPGQGYTIISAERGSIGFEISPRKRPSTIPG
jgi:hypothetical protein